MLCCCRKCGVLGKPAQQPELFFCKPLFLSVLSFSTAFLERSVGYSGSSIDCSHPTKTHPTKTLPRRNFFADRVDSIYEALHWIDGQRDT
jgi:hypothetical protein